MERKIWRDVTIRINERRGESATRTERPKLWAREMDSVVRSYPFLSGLARGRAGSSENTHAFHFENNISPSPPCCCFMVCWLPLPRMRSAARGIPTPDPATRGCDPAVGRCPPSGGQSILHRDPCVLRHISRLLTLEGAPPGPDEERVML